MAGTSMIIPDTFRSTSLKNIGKDDMLDDLTKKGCEIVPLKTSVVPHSAKIRQYV